MLGAGEEALELGLASSDISAKFLRQHKSQFDLLSRRCLLKGQEDLLRGLTGDEGRKPNLTTWPLLGGMLRGCCVQAKK